MTEKQSLVCGGEFESTEYMDIVIVSGMSGSGKTIALNALEDLGYFCVDNLPVELIVNFLQVERTHQVNRLAISVDVRTANSLKLLPEQLKLIEQDPCIRVMHLFLDAQNETLIKRFSETRRRHPLLGTGFDEQLVLREAIEKEREILAAIRTTGVRIIDTTRMRSSELQTMVKTMVHTVGHNMTLVFESFAFKNGPPIDANLVMDVRVLPNPYYNLELRPLTGRDPEVQAFFANEPMVQKMLNDLTGYLSEWLPASAANHRSYFKVCIGCTGGQHRSVYLTEKLYEHFSKNWMAIKRHRELNVAVETANFSPLTA